MSLCRVPFVLGVSAALGALTLAFVPLQAKPAAKAQDAAPAAADASGTYTIDATHSSAIFRVKHMGVSWFYGAFKDVSGTFAWDAAHPEKSSVELTIAVESVDTRNEKRDQHLKSADFFSAAEFPEITFKSSKVKQVKEGVLEVTGELSLHGQSQPLTVQVELAGMAPAGGRRPAMAGFETTFTIQRSAFGMDNMLEALGDEVRVTLSVEAGKSS
jgi:polyisoprenoid-binding protein YceI